MVLLLLLLLHVDYCSLLHTCASTWSSPSSGAAGATTTLLLPSSPLPLSAEAPPAAVPVADWWLVVAREMSDLALKRSSERSWAWGRSSRQEAERRLCRLPLRIFCKTGEGREGDWLSGCGWRRRRRCPLSTLRYVLYNIAAAHTTTPFSLQQIELGIEEDGRREGYVAPDLRRRWRAPPFFPAFHRTYRPPLFSSLPQMKALVQAEED